MSSPLKNGFELLKANQDLNPNSNFPDFDQFETFELWKKKPHKLTKEEFLRKLELNSLYKTITKTRPKKNRQEDDKDLLNVSDSFQYRIESLLSEELSAKDQKNSQTMSGKKCVSPKYRKTSQSDHKEERKTPPQEPETSNFRRKSDTSTWSGGVSAFELKTLYLRCPCKNALYAGMSQTDIAALHADKKRSKTSTAHEIGKGVEFITRSLTTPAKKKTMFLEFRNAEKAMEPIREGSRALTVMDPTLKPSKWKPKTPVNEGTGQTLHKSSYYLPEIAMAQRIKTDEVKNEAHPEPSSSQKKVKGTDSKSEEETLLKSPHITQKHRKIQKGKQKNFEILKTTFSLATSNSMSSQPNLSQQVDSFDRVDQEGFSKNIRPSLMPDWNHPPQQKNPSSKLEKYWFGSSNFANQSSPSGFAQTMYPAKTKKSACQNRIKKFMNSTTREDQNLPAVKDVKSVESLYLGSPLTNSFAQLDQAKQKRKGTQISTTRERPLKKEKLIPLKTKASVVRLKLIQHIYAPVLVKN